MANLAEELQLACNYCERACQDEDGYWFCVDDENDFPCADWDSEEEDESECSSFEYNGGYRNT